MSKILVVSPVPTHPPTAGNRARVLEMTQALIRLGHEIHFMHVQRESGDVERMREHWGNDRYIPAGYARKPARARRLWRQFARRAGLESAHTFGIDEWYDPAIDAAISRLRERIHFDAVLVEYVFMSRALEIFPTGTLKVLDTHDEFADRHRRYLRQDQQPRWYSCTPREERRGLNRADVILAIQEEEAESFRARAAGKRVVVVGHFGVVSPLTPSEIVPGRLLMIGSDNPINVSGFEWFKEAVLPLVRRDHPGCELAVGGTLCRMIEAEPGIRLLGEMDDLAAAYATAQVVVNPMQFGTGLKIKTLEALRYARALVTTPVGAQGLENGAGQAFSVSEEAQAFADRIGELLAHPDRALALGQAAVRFAEAYGDRMRDNLESVFGGARQVGEMVS